MIYREVRMQRKDRPHEMWHCRFEENEQGELIVRCGVCLQGAVEPRVGAACPECGAVVEYVYPGEPATGGAESDA